MPIISSGDVAKRPCSTSIRATPRSTLDSTCPNARIIVMLRNPVDLVESLHAQLVYSRDEVQIDFRTAWKLCASRKAGYRIPPRCRDPKVLWYDEVAKLGEQVERWQNYFSRGRIKFVCFDDLVTDTAQVYRDVLDFLDLPDDGRQVFNVVNARKTQRLSVVADFTERTPNWLVALAMRARSCWGSNAGESSTRSGTGTCAAIRGRPWIAPASRDSGDVLQGCPTAVDLDRSRSRPLDQSQALRQRQRNGDSAC